ncbi:MAG: hypothetical protein N2327_08510 [Caldimicrobium sp.]|nr:hypothetical protein [Caldimicrobium sp.]MCX7874451.1 hypothetical protein [Caldimicrobium sp.]MDW8094964.1 hypothetical protein [Caldimicrobium sp.]
MEDKRISNLCTHLTEIPIVQGLVAQGVKGGPALNVLLAGCAVSLPSPLVLKVITMAKKTLFLWLSPSKLDKILKGEGLPG